MIQTILVDNNNRKAINFIANAISDTTDTTWTGVKSPYSHKAYINPKIHFDEIENWGTNYSQFDYIVVTMATELSEASIHAIQYFSPASVDSPEEVGEDIQHFSSYADCLWIVLSHYVQQVLDDIPDWIGVLQVVDGKLQVIRQALILTGNGSRTSHLANALLKSKFMTN